jgi:hypothetical protein
MSDYPAILAEQRSNAALQLGLTGVNLGRGQESRFWPNLTGHFAVRVLDYWAAEARRVEAHVGSIPDSAIRTAWLRAVKVAEATRKQVLDAAPHKLLPEPVAVLVWTSADGVGLPLRALSTTPTKWELVVESVEEAIAEAGSGLKTIAALVAVAVLGLVFLKFGGR